MKDTPYRRRINVRAVFAVSACIAMVSGLIVLASGEPSAPSGKSSSELFKQVQIFSDAITIIETEYVKKIEVKDLIQGAIRGMMKTLDGYSQFLDRESFNEIKEETKGEFGGIGVEIGIRDGMLTIIAPIEGTPASNSGLMAGDKILKIDGEITRDITLDEAVKKLRGISGTEVTITIVRDDGSMADIALERAVIKLKSIKVSRMLTEDIAYIKLVEFQERTSKDIDSALRDLKGQGARALVLDLRNNPGGLLESSIEVAEKFLSKGELIVYTEGRDPGQRTEFFSGKDPEHDDIAIVALVNKGSASAAEILAGALKDNKRALLLGETTFGKGSVQTVVPLRDDTAIRLTTAAYFTPSGRNLMDKGIEPDILVESPSWKDKQEDAADPDEDRSELFEKVEKEKNTEREKVSEEIDPGEDLEDEQILAAVNILRGVRVFEENKAKRTLSDV